MPLAKKFSLPFFFLIKSANRITYNIKTFSVYFNECKSCCYNILDRFVHKVQTVPKTVNFSFWTQKTDTEFLHDKVYAQIVRKCIFKNLIKKFLFIFLFDHSYFFACKFYLLLFYKCVCGYTVSRALTIISFYFRSKIVLNFNFKSIVV